MRKNLSLYLDLLRLLAAFGVVLSHTGRFLIPSLPYRLWGNGPECVAVFFVLSGFVIRFVSIEKNERDWRSYAIARLSRIMPVALLALIVTLIADWVGRAQLPAAYEHYGPVDLVTTLSHLGISLLFLNEVWTANAIFGSNGPYWSLGFEVPYYLAFGLAIFLTGRIRWVALTLWALIFGPKVVAYLSLWLMGVATYDYIRKRQPYAREKLIGAALIGSSIVGFWIVKYKLGLSVHFIYQLPSLDYLFEGLAYYIAVATLCVANIIGADMLLGDRAIAPPRIEAAIRWLAGGSFTLYLCHYPLMLLTSVLFPGVVWSWENGLLALCVVVGCCYVLAEFAERRKRGARRFFDAVLPGGTAKPSGPSFAP